MHLSEGIDIQNGLAGGVIIGLSASVFLLVSGKITGLSGIAEGLVHSSGTDWNWTYTTGLVVSGAILAKLKPDAFGPATEINPGAIIVAGLLTGFGTRLSGGCTSGHGLCGLSRRSPRSLMAVLSFMFSGAVTAFLTRSPQYLHSLVYHQNQTLIVIKPEGSIMYWIPTLSVLALSLISSYQQNTQVVAREKPDKSTTSSIWMHLASFGNALVFGLGLGISGMCNPDKVLGFLDFSNESYGWNPTLMSVLGAGCAVTFAAFHYFTAAKTTVVLNKSSSLNNLLKMGIVKENMVMDWKLILGKFNLYCTILYN